LKLAAPPDPANPAVEFAFKQVLEARIALAPLGAHGSASLRFQFSLWQGGLPMDAVPQQGWIELSLQDQVEWAV